MLSLKIAKYQGYKSMVSCYEDSAENTLHSLCGVERVFGVGDVGKGLCQDLSEDSDSFLLVELLTERFIQCKKEDKTTKRKSHALGGFRGLQDGRTTTNDDDDDEEMVRKPA